MQLQTVNRLPFKSICAMKTAERTYPINMQQK
jgi:hypothetical protein